MDDLLTYEPPDPDYGRIFTQARIIAWQYGFALLAHGSRTRDLDLLMVPWEERAYDRVVLPVVNRIAQVAGLTVKDDAPRDKPHGRKAFTLFLPDGVRWVDLSVMPCAKHEGARLMTTDTPAAAPTAERVAHLAIEYGAKYPYDASDDWWESNKDAPPAVDWAHAAARGILHDLNDRRGIKNAFREIDEDVRKEMVSAHAAIIRAALSAQPAWVERGMELADSFADAFRDNDSTFRQVRAALRTHLSTALTAAASAPHNDQPESRHGK